MNSRDEAIEKINSLGFKARQGDMYGPDGIYIWRRSVGAKSESGIDFNVLEGAFLLIRDEEGWVIRLFQCGDYKYPTLQQAVDTAVAILMTEDPNILPACLLE